VRNQGQWISSLLDCSAQNIAIREEEEKGVERERYSASTKERAPDNHLYRREMGQAPALTRSIGGGNKIRLERRRLKWERGVRGLLDRNRIGRRRK
jgi:hypothetical protein